MILVTLFFACPPVVDTDSGDTAAHTGDTGDTGDTGSTAVDYTTAVVATVADDYSAAVLATVDLDDGTVHDGLTTLPSDVGVVAEAGHLFVLGRFGYDLVRVYTPGAWSEPVAEFSVGDGGNPYDVHVCGGSAFVSLYGQDALERYDPASWLLSGVVDLSSLADSDGIPEIAEMVEQDDTLFVAVQQLDQDNGWVANGGLVAAVGCTAGTLDAHWEVGPNPSLHEVPGEAGFYVRTGVYYDDEYNLMLDGIVAWFDPATGLGAPLLAEGTLGENITDVAMVDKTHGLLLTQDAASAYTAWCWDVGTGTTTELFSTTSYLAGAVAGEGGEVWISARQSWTDPESQGGILTVDALTCAPGSEVWHSDLQFAPSSIAFY